MTLGAHRRIWLLNALAAVVSTACGSGPPERPDDVRAAILRAGVIGQQPREVENRLHALRFKDGWRLDVDSFDSSRAEIGASMRDSTGRAPDGWWVNVSVKFDAARKAVEVEAHNSAVSPL